MVTFYTICAIVGSVILLVQLALTIVGADHHSGDALHGAGLGAEYTDTHAGASSFFHVLSFRSIVAAIAFFGLGGRAALAADMPAYFAFMAALGGGTIAMILVAWLMKLLFSLRAEGNVHIQNCIGMPATVYLSIPGAKKGVGKVTIAVQQRTMEYAAVTGADASIPTGARVVVVGISGADTLEVEPE